MSSRFDKNEYNIDWSGVKTAVDYYKRGDLNLFGFYMEKSIPDLRGFEKLLTSPRKSDNIKQSNDG